MEIGPVGLMAVAGARLEGAGRIIVVGPSCFSRNGKAYGATDVVDYKQGDIVAQILELTNNKGVDRTVIAGGNADIMLLPLKLQPRRQHRQCQLLWQR